MRFCFADLQIHWLALVIVEYLLCVSYIFHKWKIMWHGAPLCLNAYEYCYVTDLGHISPPGLLAPFVIFVPQSIRCVIHTNYTCYFVNHCFVCLGVLHGAGEPGSKCISLGFRLSCSDPLIWFHSRHNTKYLLRHLLQLHVLSLMLLFGYFLSVGLVQVRLGPGVCMYRYICVYICLYIHVYICVCIRWNFVSCYDPLICFHSMLCCTFMTINMLWFWCCDSEQNNDWNE